MSQRRRRGSSDDIRKDPHIRAALAGFPLGTLEPIRRVAGNRPLGHNDSANVALVLEGVIWLLVMKTGVFCIPGGAVVLVGNSIEGPLGAEAVFSLGLAIMVWSPIYAFLLYLVSISLKYGNSRTLELDARRFQSAGLRLAPYGAAAAAVLVGAVAH